MQKREIWKVIVFGIITLGIYDLVWLYKTRNEMVAKGAKVPSFVLLLLPLIVLLAAMVFMLVLGFGTRGADVSNGGTAAASALVMLVVALSLTASIPITIYWTYKYCKAVEQVTRGKLALGLNFVMLIVLSLLGVGVLWPSIVQDAFNKTN